MAFAISPPSVATGADTRTRAMTWTGISAGIALIATVPLVMILTDPMSKLLFVRGAPHDGDWAYAFAVILILLAPATYALFFGTAGELLKTRAPARVHKATMRVAAVGILPYLVMATAAVYWQSGPQEALMLTAGLTVPIAMATTIWAAGQNH